MSSPAGRRHRTEVILCLLCLAGLAAIEMGAITRPAEYALLTALLALCCVPPLNASSRRALDPFEPVYPVILSTAAYFVVIGSVLVWTGSVRMRGIDYRAELAPAIFLAALALLSYYAGYYDATSEPSTAGDLTPPIFDLQRTRSAATLLLIATAAMFAAWIILAGVPIRTLSIFTGAGYRAWIDAGTGTMWGPLYAAQEAWPACWLLLAAGRRWTFPLILPLIAIVIVFACLGVRARLLLAVGAPFAFWYLQHSRRPRLSGILASGLAMFVLIVGLVGKYRAPEQYRTSASGLGFSNAWTQFIAGADIATASAVYVHCTRTFGYQWGKNFAGVLVLPVPRAIWPGKYKLLEPQPVDNYLQTGAAAPFFIEFYRSFGSPLVVLGCAALGWICGRVYLRYRRRPDDVFAQATLALVWAYSFHMYGRNSATLLLGGLAFVFAPVWICRRLARLKPHVTQSHTAL